MSDMRKTYEQLVEEAIAELDGGFTAFDGDDFCENCRGWDGKNRRCDCGNRRVEWNEGDDGTFVYPAAW